MDHSENEFLQPVQSAKTLSPLDSDENYENCPHCARRFFVGRLSPHLKSCSNKNPYKKIVVSKKFLAKIETPISNLAPNYDNNDFSEKNYILNDNVGGKSGIGKDGKSIGTPTRSRNNQNINLKENNSEEKNENRRKIEGIHGSPNQNKVGNSRKNDEKHDAGIKKEGNSNFDHDPNEEHEEKVNSHNFSFENKKKKENQNNILNNEAEERVECSVCNRKFYTDRIEVHEKACKKSSKKRKVFDSKENRVQEKKKK